MKTSITKLFAILVCINLMIQLGNAQTSFSGKVLYHDNPDLPVGNVLVSIMDTQNNTVSSMTTGPNGVYTFENIPNGSYVLTGSTTAPSGGVTIHDATLVLLHILLPSRYPFTPLQSLAADVDGSGTITKTDFYMILKNYLTNGEPFPIGNWVFTKQPFTLNGTKSVPPSTGGSSSGDVSGIWMPGTRSLAALMLDESTPLSINANSSFDVNLTSRNSLQLNGAGIVLNYSGDMLTVEAATCKSDEYYVNITENQVRINWIKTDGNAIDFAANEPIVTLTCRAKDNFTAGMSTHFLLDPATSLVNKDNEEINTFKLSMPLVEHGKPTISLSNYPNPFVGTTVITYGIPVEGSVRLEIFALTGQKIKTINAGYQTAGNHSIDLEANDMKPGMYFYKLSVTGTSTFSQTKQMIISN
jgi:Carboxypeptidase regulatory-like domain/Secretion system C-terminal sorting domain